MTEYNSDILNEVAGRNVYTVPERYFDTLSGRIMSVINQNQLLQAPQQTPYQIPTGYFETLSSHILSKVHSHPGAQTVAGKNEVYQELQQLAPLLNTISKHNVFSIPEGYFTESEVAIIAGIPARASKAKAISLSSRIHKWVSYSTAAAIAAIMVTAAFMFTDNNTTGNAKTGNYYNINTVDVKKEISVLSEDEIVNYLSTHPSNADVSTSTNNVSPDIQHIVNDISEEEIRQYLKENSDPGEVSAKGI